jgi:glycosyltransferase involved in cell wall biosynthesis
MKLLFCGPLKDFSGFAHASRSFLKCLNEGNLDLAARAITYDKLDGGKSIEPQPWLEELLRKDIQNVDMVIQMTTCNIEAVPVPGVCNGLYTFIESDRMQAAWVAKANEFDFIMVSCRANAEAMVRSGVTTPVLVCAVPCDKEMYEKPYTAYPIENAGERTIFYNICQLSQKKGIDALLRAYYAAFADTPDDVLLVLKTYVNMADRTHDMEMIKNFINRVKMSCRIPTDKLPPVLPLVQTMTDYQINGLHKRGDAYVCSSRAEGWCLPVFDALGHGNTVITNTAGGLNDFVRQEHALIYQGTSTFFYDIPHADPGLFTGVEQCFEPSPVEMAFLMRKFHLLKKGAREGVLNEENQKEWESILQRQANAKAVSSVFDYRAVHSKVIPQLESVFANWSRDDGTPLFEVVKDGDD